MENKIRGGHGEDLAVLFLQKKNYQIIERNVKLSYKEIDIIARQGRLTVFVEVKYRTNAMFGRARDAITKSKIKNMKRGAIDYCVTHKIKLENIRFDFIAIDEPIPGSPEVEHFEDII